MKQFYIFLLSGMFLLIVGCGNSNDPSNGTSKEDVRTILSGRIVDETGAAVESATVACGSKTETTDASGIFKLTGISDIGGIIVSAKKVGYFDAFRRLVKFEKGATTISLAMRRKQKIAQFSAADGITAQLGNGASVSIPANGFKAESTGATYTGQIDLYAYNLDPAQDSYADFFPDDCTARDTADKETTLFSHGINRVELYSPSGEKLNLRSGATARMSYPIPQALTGLAPASIPIWHFDEPSGLWKETGIAQLQGNSYVVDVEHFSTINLDAKGPKCTVIVSVVDCGNNPVSGITVSAGSYQRASTELNGEVEIINVPVEMSNGVPASLSVMATKNMNGQLGSKTITISNLKPGETRRVTLMLESSSLSGKLVDCSGNSISGMIKAEWTNNGFSSTYADGSFTLAVPTNTTVNLTAAGKQFSVTIPAGCNPYTIGDIKIDPTGNDCQQGGGGTSTCSLIWSFKGQTYNANDNIYQGVVPCGAYVQGLGLSIRGLISSNLSEGLNLSGQGIPATLGTYEIGIIPGNSASAIVTLDSSVYTSGYYDATSNKEVSAKGTLTIESVTSSEVQGRFTCTLYKYISLDNQPSAVLTGTFRVPRK